MLPDRHRLLQRVDHPPARIERRATMRRSHRNQHTGLAHNQPSQAGAQSQPHAPQTSQSLQVTQSLHQFRRHLFIRLVVQVQRLPSACVVPHNAVEHANRAITAGLDLTQSGFRLDRTSRTIATCASGHRHSPAEESPPHRHRPTLALAVRTPGSRPPPPIAAPRASKRPSALQTLQQVRNSAARGQLAPLPALRHAVAPGPKRQKTDTHNRWTHPERIQITSRQGLP